MNSERNLSAMGENMVYFKSIRVEDLPQDVQDKAGDLTTLCAVHNHEGEQIALVATPRLAVHLAREHDMTPVSLH